MVFSNEPGIYRPNIDGYRAISSMIVDRNEGTQITNILSKNYLYNFFQINQKYNYQI